MLYTTALPNIVKLEHKADLSQISLTTYNILLLTIHLLQGPNMKKFIYSFLLFCTISSSSLAAKITVIYHSGYGHTEVIAKAVYQGAIEVKGTKAELIKVSSEGKISEADWKTLEKV